MIKLPMRDGQAEFQRYCHS